MQVRNMCIQYAHIKGGNVKYMSAVKLSNKASTPAALKVTPSGDTSNSSVMSNTRFTAAQKDVMKKSSMRWKQVDRFMEIRNMVISQRLLQTAVQSTRSQLVQVSGMVQKHSVFETDSCNDGSG